MIIAPLLHDARKARAESMSIAAAVPAEDSNAYRDICSQLGSLAANRLSLLVRFREDSPMVQQVQEEITRLDFRKKQLEEQYPSLVTADTLPLPIAPGLDMPSELSHIRGLAARISVLTNQLGKVRAVHFQVIQDCL
jgi:hypothetical protein